MKHVYPLHCRSWKDKCSEMTTMFWRPTIPSSCSLSSHIFQENLKHGLVFQQKWMRAKNPNIQSSHLLFSSHASCYEEAEQNRILSYSMHQKLVNNITQDVCCKKEFVSAQHWKPPIYHKSNTSYVMKAWQHAMIAWLSKPTNGDDEGAEAHWQVAVAHQGKMKLSMSYNPNCVSEQT